MPALSVDRELDQLLTASSAESRYVDLALRFRRPLADFARDVPEGTRVWAGDVELITVAAGRLRVPVASVERGASGGVPDGAQLLDGPAGQEVAQLRPQVLLQAGGRWDTLNRCYAPEPPHQVVTLDIQESQVEAVEWGAAFLHAYREKLPRQHSALLNYGARRGGKTWILLMLMVAFCLEVPDLITAAVSVSHTRRTVDIDRNIRQLIPQAWWSYRQWPVHEFSFLNGSVITNLSTKDKTAPKQGQRDFYLLNEAAEMPQAIYENSLGGTADTGGLVMLASNPPAPGNFKGEWVQVMVQRWEAAGARGETDYPLHVLKTDWKGNAAIDQPARGRVARLLREVNPAASDADDEGLMLPVSPRAFSWHPKYAAGATLQEDGRLLIKADGASALLPDITREFLRKRGAPDREALVGVDFQKWGGIVGSWWKLFGRLDKPVLCCIADLTIDGSEDDFLDEVEETWGPAQLLFVGDSSGLTQDFEHNPGKTSFGPFFARGWKITPPTIKRHATSKAPKNPPVSRSLSECNRMIGEARVWCLSRARAMADCLASCDRKDSKAGPYPVGPQRHQADGFRYVAWWVEPPARAQRVQGRARAAEAT